MPNALSFLKNSTTQASGKQLKSYTKNFKIML
jgi:hypothetical protein